MSSVEQKSARIQQQRLQLQAKADSNMEVAVQETELQAARGQIQHLQALLEEKHRQCETYAEQTRQWQARYEALNQQYEPTFTENRRLREAQAAAEFPDAVSSQPASYSKTGTAADDSIFASAVELARACAGEQVVFDSEAQLVAFFHRMGLILSVLLNAVLKLLRARWEFQAEYLQETLVDASAWAKLATLSEEELRQLLLAPDLPEAKFAAHCQSLQQAINELMLHQLALLNGYRASVRDGVPNLLRLLDPAVLAEQAEAQKVKIGFWQISPRALPWLWQRRLLSVYRQKYNDLAREDRSTFNRMFRPGFIQGYKKCMVQGAEGRGQGK
jgi:predicted component of type VI protein secretion system